MNIETSLKVNHAVSPMETIAYEMNAEFDRTHWWFLGRNKIICSALERLVGNLKAKTVLDFGCGTGGVSESLRPNFSAYTCYEPSKEGSAICRKRGLHVFQTLEELKTNGQRFDLAVCLDVIEHVEDDSSVLKEMQSHLLPGGLALVTVPAYEWLWGGEDVVSRHLRRYTLKTLRKAIDQAELETVFISGFNSFLLPLQMAVVFLNRNLHPKEVMSGTQTNLSKPGWLQQAICLTVMKFEAWLLKRFRLPVGGSLIAVMRRRD